MISFFLWIGIIGVLFILFLWYNTTVYDYKQTKQGIFGKVWGLCNERRISITVIDIIGLLLLLIPFYNAVVGLPIMLMWYVKRTCYPETEYECVIYKLELKRYSPWIYKLHFWFTKELFKL